MRYSRVFPLLTGVALIAACGDGGNGPDNTPPVATFTYQCTDLTCTFTDNSSDEDGTITTHNWNFGDNTTGTGPQASHTYAAAGTYNATVTARDNDGETTTSAAQAVTVTAPSATAQASFDAVCTGPVCVIDNTSTATGVTTTYAWDFGNGTTSTDQDPAAITYSVDEPTTFTITLLVTSDGVQSQATKQVRVSPAATLSCNGTDCALHLDAASTVVVTLVSHSCEAHGNTFAITAPAPETLFTDGCFAPVSPAPGSSFTLNSGAAYAAGTDLQAAVLTGVAGAENPLLEVSGSFATGWTLNFDDGFVGPNEPDKDDLIITVKATPVP